MLYSWMSEGNSCYVNLHAEEIIRTQGGKEPFGELLQENPRRSHLLVDFYGTEEMNEETALHFRDCMDGLLKAENRICLLHMNVQVARRAKEELAKRGYAGDFLAHKDNPALFWGCVSLEAAAGPDEKDILALSEEIFKSNLFILMEEGPKGKWFNMPRLVRDGELCLYYFFYCLAQKLAQEKDMATEAGADRRICLVPDNAQSAIMAEALGKLLGVDAVCEYPVLEPFWPDGDYLIVRDVLHMGCELDGLTAAITGAGGVVKGVACLVDIDTGVGKRHKRYSLHTIKLERGIINR